MKKINKVTSAKMAKLASKTLKGYEPTRDEIEALAASVMSQREREIEAKAAATAAPEAPVMLTEPAPAASPMAEPLPALSISGEALTPVEEILLEEAAQETPEAAPEKRGFWSNLFK